MKELDYKQDKRKKWRWSADAGNGVTVGASSQGFTRKADAKKNARRLRDFLAECEL